MVLPLLRGKRERKSGAEGIRRNRKQVRDGSPAPVSYTHLVDAFIQSALAKLLDDSLGLDDLVALTLETGKYGVDGMALLDGANTGAYGNPEITEVNIGVRNNPGILVSGHDLKDLEQLLEQTKGTGVDAVSYTHLRSCRQSRNS